VATVKSDIEIARAASLLPIRAIGEKLGVPEDAMLAY
jgi:formyltetrahydrofolate synthetase